MADRSLAGDFPSHAIARKIALAARSMRYTKVSRSAAGPQSRSAYVFCDGIKIRVADHQTDEFVNMDVHTETSCARPGSVSVREAIRWLRKWRLDDIVGARTTDNA